MPTRAWVFPLCGSGCLAIPLNREGFARALFFVGMSVETMVSLTMVVNNQKITDIWISKILSSNSRSV